MNYERYENDKPYPHADLAPEHRKTMRKAYNDRQAEIQAEFRADLEDEYETAGHPKADKLWELAWDYGHSSGLREVELHYAEFAELVK